MNEHALQKAKELLQTPTNIVVVGHKNPDGDAIGSCLGLAEYLQWKGHNVAVIMPNDFPDFLKWMPHNESITIYEKETGKATELIENAKIICTLDFNALNRTGEMTEALEKATATFVMIDHHQQPDDYALVPYSDVAMSSTSEMVYHFIDAVETTPYLTSSIATNLYTGIMTDTGSFRFPSTTATTHRVIAELISAGAENSEIHQKVFDSNSPQRLELLGVALSNMVVLEDFNTAYITISQKELDAHQFKKGDTEGFVNYPLSIKGIIFSVIFIENKAENITKISLRSKGSFSVNEFAREHFNGGGHRNAAGGKADKPLEETVKDFISILPSYKNALNHDS